ncbi:hypothetical protein LCGC14_1672230 [marine sediment metagenome]|uniref:Uncharacterized protein n=1 Tax=marine sediment metagenome TaxID=412755 RepID=A0A0F9KQU9_9ZZZZ
MTDKERKRLKEMAPYPDLLLDYVQGLLNEQYDEGWDNCDVTHGVDTG